MGITFYTSPGSAPARMVLLLAKHMDVKMDVKILDMQKQEHLTPEFLAINPQHTVPTMVDNNFILTESRAMLMYLANKYGRDESLYPKDPEKRALVDMRLFFDISTFYTRFAESHYPVMFQQVKPGPDKMAKLDEAFEWLELFLKDGYIAGSQLTIADFSMAAILSTIEACGYEISKFQKTAAYLARCKGVMKGWEELNQEGADMFGQWYKGSLASLNNLNSTNL